MNAKQYRAIVGRIENAMPPVQDAQPGAAVKIDMSRAVAHLLDHLGLSSESLEKMTDAAQKTSDSLEMAGLLDTFADRLAERLAGRLRARRRPAGSKGRGPADRGKARRPRTRAGRPKVVHYAILRRPLDNLPTGCSIVVPAAQTTRIKNRVTCKNCRRAIK